jgi:16S rRNA (guanine527-N7)-methyltransferase
MTDDDSLCERIQAGAKMSGICLEPEQADQLTRYLSHLEHWNHTINLTALPLAGYPAPTLERLILQPLRSAAFFPQQPFSWFDFGSGGGSPAIPLRIVLPAASLTMIESRSRKVAFLRDVVRRLGLLDVGVRWDRVEVASQSVQPGTVDFLTIRALRIDRPFWILYGTS